MQTNMCPVCGFRGLLDPPRSEESGGGSYEICPCCSFQFGVSDDDLGMTYEQWRAAWIASGMSWDKGDSSPPPGWDPRLQLKALASGGASDPDE